MYNTHRQIGLIEPLNVTKKVAQDSTFNVMRTSAEKYEIGDASGPLINSWGEVINQVAF